MTNDELIKQLLQQNEALSATIAAQTRLIARLNQTIQGKDSLSYYHYHKFDKRYDVLIRQAREENPLPETTEKNVDVRKKENEGIRMLPNRGGSQGLSENHVLRWYGT